MSHNCKAQLPQCSGAGTRYVYLISLNAGGGSASHVKQGKIYNLDPLQPISINNPVENTIPAANTVALTVSPNLNGPGPSPTFYAISNSGQYTYWDGSAWTNTGHSTGHISAVNIGAGGGYIFSLNGLTGDIYRYNGTGNAIYITTVAGFGAGGPFDLVADCDGNFYILRTAAPQFLRQYRANGTLLNQWTLSGAPLSTGGGGFAIVNNKVYFDNYGSYYEGTFSGNNINFTSLYTITTPDVHDFASCPLIAINTKRVRPNITTAYYCGSGPGVPIKAIGGTGIFSWSVLSGPATITGAGDSISVTATDSAKILFTFYDTAFCGVRGTDTIAVVVPRANLDAGLPKHITGCGRYIDSLEATLTGMTAGVLYNITWAPAASVTIPGPNKLKPIIAPTANTTYIITASTSASQGSCVWSDSVKVTVEDLSEGTTDFSYEIDYGCTEDTVKFNNLSTSGSGTLSYIWNFGDSSAVNNTVNPVHIYTRQGVYNVTVVKDNGICKDTVKKELSILHPLQAGFNIDNTIFCTSKPVKFDSSPTIVLHAPQPPGFKWDFGDGTFSTVANPVHTYSTPGNYKVLLTVTDFVPCIDTVSRILNNFLQPPYVDAGPADTVLCEGDALYLPVGISNRGTSYLWSTGETSPKIMIAQPGKYYVELHNDCGVHSDTINITFNDCSTWMPDAFSPNGDGINDQIRFRTKYPEQMSSFSFSIYNRKGNMVFHTEDIQLGWNGNYNYTPQPIDAYYYMIQFMYRNEKRLMKGNITLVR